MIKQEGPNPDHSLKGTTIQIFGTNSSSKSVKMNGFVKSARSTVYFC